MAEHGRLRKAFEGILELKELLSLRISAVFTIGLKHMLWSFMGVFT